MILASEILADDSMSRWAVNVVQLGVLGILAFLVRNAFEGVAASIKEFGLKLDGMSTTIAKADGDRRVLEQRVHALEQHVEELKKELRDISEGADGDRRVLEQRVHALEQHVEELKKELRDISEGVAR